MNMRVYNLVNTRDLGYYNSCEYTLQGVNGNIVNVTGYTNDMPRVSYNSSDWNAKIKVMKNNVVFGYIFNFEEEIGGDIVRSTELLTNKQIFNIATNHNVKLSNLQITTDGKVVYKVPDFFSYQKTGPRDNKNINMPNTVDKTIPYEIKPFYKLFNYTYGNWKFEFKHNNASSGLIRVTNLETNCKYHLIMRTKAYNDSTLCEIAQHPNDLWVLPRFRYSFLLSNNVKQSIKELYTELTKTDANRYSKNDQFITAFWKYYFDKIDMKERIADLEYDYEHGCSEDSEKAYHELQYYYSEKINIKPEYYYHCLLGARVDKTGSLYENIKDKAEGIYFR